MDESIESMIVDEGEIILPVSVEYRDDITKDDFYELCRLCGNCSKQLIPIFTGDGAEHSLPEKIKEHLPLIRVTQDDSLPLNVCYQCASTLIAWHELYYACQEADQRLREICRKMQLKTEITSGEIYDEIPIDFMISDKVKKCEDSLDEQDDVENTEADPELSDASTSINSTTDVVYEKNLEMATENHKIAESSTPNDGCKLSNQYMQYSETFSSTFVTGTADRDKFVTEDTFSMECYKLECEKLEVCSLDGCTNDKQVELIRLENNSKEKINHSCLSSSPSGQETDSNYDRFMVVYRNRMRYMQCDKCTFVCRPSISIFSNHYRLHDTDDSFEENISAKNVFQCKLCNRMFANQSTLIEHTARKHDEVRVFECKRCDLKFNTKLEFRSHIRSHKTLTSSTKGLKCDFCGKEFKTRSGYINHRTNVCVQYRCDLCDETFLIKTLLLDHSKKVHNVQIIEPSSEVQQKVPSFSVCPICGKSISKTAINRHIQLHSEEKPYICDLCGKQFRFKWSLREHIMVEIGMKDFVCEICGKKFVIQAYLNKHMRFHMMCDGKFEGYQCEICGKKYAEEWRVKEHQRNTHQKRSPPQFKCDVCDKKYSRRWLVRSHRRLAHEAFDSVQEYQCEHCGKKFAEKWIIKLHLQTLHNVCCGQQDETDKVALPTAEEFLTRVEYDNVDNTVESELITRSQEDTVGEKGQKHEKKTFECELCKKSFATKQGMKNHLYAELNLRKYACDICGKRYNWWMGLKEHLIMNHGEKEFVCNVCEKDFPTKKRYQDHMSVHSNSRPYECGCGNSFKLRRYLAKHQKRSCKMFKMPNT